jgi:hypothetical protein
MLQHLDTPPPGTDAFFWSDFAELRALTHPDKCYSRGDLDGLGTRNRTRQGRLNTEERWRTLIDFCGIRRNEFSDSYPFRVSDDEDTLELDYVDSPAQRLYLSLLIASAMRHLASKRQVDIARAFEQTCFTVFGRLMPTGSEVRATWANGGPEAPYVGQLYEKLTQLAKDIRGNPNIKSRDFKENNTGDGGIDLIAWHPMADERNGIPISFAQCGCSRDDWTFKQAEASPFQHKCKFNVRHEWATYYFMPIDLREFDGGWAYESKIGSVIIVDRLRLLRLANQYNLYGELPEFPFVDEVLGMSEL